MTDAQKLKRHPAIILRRAMTHLRKRWGGHKGLNGRASMLILKEAIARVEQAEFRNFIRRMRYIRRRR